MKYLVIWFCLHSAFGISTEIGEHYTFKPNVVERRVKDNYEYEYRNYKIVDTFKEAMKVAEEKVSAEPHIRVYIYELGQQYNVKIVPYTTYETVERTKYKTEIEKVK